MARLSKEEIEKKTQNVLDTIDLVSDDGLMTDPMEKHKNLYMPNGQNTMAYIEGNSKCVMSPNKALIDKMLNEHASFTSINKKLAELGESISVPAISAYAKKRENALLSSAVLSPEFQETSKRMMSMYNNAIGKIKGVDLLGKLESLIKYSEELVDDARIAGAVEIKNAKDLSMVGETLVKAITEYSKVIQIAQQIKEIDDDPSLIRPQNINVEIKDQIVNVLQDSIKSGNFGMVDQIRNAIDVECEEVS
jgi:hypothetical protein